MDFCLCNACFLFLNRNTTGKKYSIEQKIIRLPNFVQNKNNISKASKDPLINKFMDLSDVSELKSYLAYNSMDLSDVHTAPTPTLLLIHGFIVEVLR